MAHVNKLISETSPYLLQHAHNPVNWYPWGEEALQRGKTENKPIIVSIGYAACHWCHVMERESFEDEATANVMNRSFICIKIDREERPDLDHFFMDALQAISGQGGWPLNMFLTPDALPFYGGTYFPPKRLQNRISWIELLEQINDAFQNRNSEILDQAQTLTEHLKNVNKTDPKRLEAFTLSFEELFTKQQTEKIFDRIMESADLEEGGFGRAPKFPQTYTIQYLLRFFYYTKNMQAHQQATLSLKKMMHGGIYDQIGGGFCRYSTDQQWLAPHFEKMTYDNALLLIALAEAFQITGDDEYKKTMEQTFAFMKREMMTEGKGFYAAIDADSEGVEGKFYTWTKDAFYQILGEDAEKLADYYDISEGGNWEHVNIPRLKKSLAAWASFQNLDLATATEIVDRGERRLLDARAKRIRPSTDDKILLGWNALFNQALTKASTALSDIALLELAKQNMDFLLITFFDSNDKTWLHTYKEGKVRYTAFLDDLAFLCQALINIYEPTGEIKYLSKAKEITEYILDHYTDEDKIYFYFTPSFQKDIPVRKKDLYDGAIPSGNAIMAWNLYRLGIYFGKPDWKKRAENMLELQKESIMRYPTSFGIWANLLLEFTKGTNEIVVLGPGAAKSTFSLLRHYIPNRVVMASEKAEKGFPLMENRLALDSVLYYLCRDYMCNLPVEQEEKLISQLAS